MKLEIRRNSDGRIATFTRPDWGVDNVWWWEEGNGACDCNRELYFCRANGEDEPEDTKCGGDRFSVRLTDENTRAVLYAEFGGEVEN